MRQEATGKKLARIKISSLNNGTHRFDFQGTASDFADETIDDERFAHPISISVNLTKAASEIIADLDVSTVVNLQCDRCLALVQKPLFGSYRIVFVQTGETIEKTSESDVRFISKNEAYINFIEDIRETLILSLPVKNVCESNCATARFPIEREFKSERNEASVWQEKLAELGKKFKN